ncbi:hypothetical protein A2856_02815 [Candidatus Uhrbacteria bacterium RIFCSPHIGHO2_01_FULL_63_20]|uniref:Uncharacterized protein n=1 Tax=Candidatus Uhrbacteria bacterium RIFCSPHIGHO2_01_FULL_63_20 TaxID=1802385 RepID=A0A1F7TKW9_9BACT|nr:MAG: hypothetical protein A2856_02815 [Candidatus Uhrbacteria bacterium RIFCSPHIGHO2_01_FULL_63_20]
MGGKLCHVHTAAYWLLVISGLQLGLSALFKFNLVHTVLGSVPVLETAFYVLAGLSAVAMLLAGSCKKCKI